MPPAKLNQECPVARTLECVGEGWSLLILRDAFQGFSRFDEFEQNLGIAPGMLSRRLAHLTAAGIFERRRYSTRPPRYEYRLTRKGHDLFPVVATMLEWGNRHLAPNGASLLLAERDSLRPLTPVLVDAASGAPITAADTAVIAGPRASRAMRARLAATRALRPAVSPLQP